MRKFAFTLLELLLVVVILTTISTIAIPNFQNAVEDSKSKICETNLKVQQASLDIYAMEHDSMPASLSMIPDEYLNRAYAKVLNAKGAWKIKLAYWLVDLSERNYAYASFLQDEIVRGHKSTLICPKDKNPAAHGNASYGLNSALAGISSKAYRNLPNDVILIADCNNRTFNSVSELDKRHVKHSIFQANPYAQGVSRNKTVGRIGPSGQDSRITPINTIPPYQTQNENNNGQTATTTGDDSVECQGCFTAWASKEAQCKSSYGPATSAYSSCMIQPDTIKAACMKMHKCE